MNRIVTTRRLPISGFPLSRLVITLCLSFLVVVSSTAPNASAQSTSPALRFVAVPGYRLTVLGTGWPRRDRVIFTVHAGPWVQGLELRATRNGSFRVGVNNVDLCGGATFQAQDMRGHHVSLRGPALLCASKLNPPVPTLSVLRGQAVQLHQVRLLTVSRPTNVTMRVGDELYLSEQGQGRPFFTPRADPTYLLLVAQGETSPGACSQANCNAGFYWEWIAIRAGQTGIGLSPACREAHPQCELPDFVLEIRILP